MGTWGEGILDDDTAADVYADYIDGFNRGATHPEILKAVMDEWGEEAADLEDQGAVIWLAVAKAQWDCGALSPRVLAKARRIVEQGIGLDRWHDPGLRRARAKALQRFLAKIGSPNPRPKKPRRAVKRKPPYEPGHCLAVRLSDGDYGAALVLARPPESDDPFTETYGFNLVAMLRYKSGEKPGLDVFERRQWLALTHHAWNGAVDLLNVSATDHRKHKAGLEVVGRVPLRATDPKESPTYGGWRHVGEQVVLQARWDRGERNPSG